MRWVTWENIGVDRMACGWLIQKFIDPAAEFAFVPVGQAPLPSDAEVFDIPGTRLSHRHGHCSFHTMLAEYSLEDPVLDRIAAMVDEADLVQEVAVEAAAPGLDLICRGIRRISTDDHLAMEHGRLIYDALYAQLSVESSTT
jgi:hypothetical protein